MAICSGCGQEMTKGLSCTANVSVSCGGRMFNTVPYVDPSRDGIVRRCHDCGVVPGGKHHSGCDMERCPICGRQLITCGCIPERLCRAVKERFAS